MSTTPPAAEAAVVDAAAPVTRLGLHGTVIPYDATQEEWGEYAERIEHYFIANDITSGAKRRAILLNAVGPATYRLLKTLVSPAKITDLSFEEIVERATKHFNPKPSPIVKRYEFNTRKQEEGETVATFVAALRKIAEYCEYGSVLDDMLRDRVVCGIHNKAVQRRLLQEPSLTFEKALEMALAAETADRDSRRLRGSSLSEKDVDTQVQQQKGESPTTDSSAVNKVDRHKSQRPGGTRERSGGNKERDCYRCGGKHHPSRCTFLDYECHYCKKKGHLAKVCRKKARKEKGQPEQANVVVDEDSADHGEEYPMFHISSGSSKPLHVTVTVNGKQLTMEVDTGASVSIINQETFELIREGQSVLELQRSAVKLQTYTGEPIKVEGSTVVLVEHNGQSASLPLIVTQEKGPTLLGRDWMSALKLDWRTIFKMEAIHTLEKVLDKYSDVFKDELGRVQGVSAKIHVDPNTRPQFHKARPVPFALRKKVEEELERLQTLGIIQPIQFSDWAAPIVPVLKDDGRVRICGDYKVTVNRAAKVDKYPIPRIDELFTSLSGGKTFSKLDLSHAYLQVTLDEESREYVTINTHKGLFKYKRLPFGVSSAPSIFQRVMENLLQGIPGVCIYIDDILVTGTSEQEHLATLAQVLSRLAAAGMRLKREKCGFLLPSVSYLGHVISAEGLSTSEAKVKAIVEAPAPRNVGELRSFLGLVNYYGKFLPDVATTLSPLYSLLQTSKQWTWGKSQREAFRDVKDLLRSPRVLVHFDDQLPLVLSCDASPYGLGAVLSHRMPDGTEKPVGFSSRTLAKAELKYSQLDKEALAIVFGVKKYHQYLYGRQFEIKTDHKPLTYIFSESKTTPAMASGRIQRWALALGAYDYTIQYKEGKNNSNADALSRLPLPTTIRHVPRPAEVVHLMEHLDTTPLSSQQIRLWTNQDPILSKVKDWVLSGWPTPTKDETDESQEILPYTRRRYELSVEKGCVLWGSRVVVPPRGRKRILEMLHEAHPGIARMKGFARGYVWWPGINEQIENCVKECRVCQSYSKQPPVAPLHPWSWPEKPWSRIHVDYAGPLEGKMFLLIMDAHTKWMEVHMTNTSTSSVTIELLRKSFASFGLPDVIVSDNATTFTSEEFAEFCKKNGVRHIRTPPYHPASNGLVERAVQTFKEGMKRLREGSLSTRLSRFLFKYRIIPHSSTGVSPAELMYGRKLRTQLDYLHPDLSRQVQQSQDRQKQGHDVHSRLREFSVGDNVYARNYGQGPLWLPGKVIDVSGSVSYLILLEDGRRAHRHVDQLKSRRSGEPITTSQARAVSEQVLEDFEVGTRNEPEHSQVCQDADRTATPPPEDSDTSAVQVEAAESRTENVEPTVQSPRRSTRVRHPPIRYGD